MTQTAGATEQMARRLQEKFSPLLETEGMVVVAMNVKRTGRTFQISCLMDKETGGITIGECARFNRIFLKTIEEEDLVPGDFFLEVSSPGLDWPLTTSQDFRRVTRREVIFDLTEPVEDKIQYTGIVEEVKEDVVTVALQDGHRVVLPIPLIRKATQKI